MAGSAAFPRRFLRWLIPGRFAGKNLTQITVDGEPIACKSLTRYGKPVISVACKETCEIQAAYHGS